ncbi:MAG: hypothetical protein LBE20_01190 [Deltaproteobacteria bacterium]|jgi:hypothetical protein|nr:hypothetical protein [Deltaproteobacteria bacterium]
MKTTKEKVETISSILQKFPSLKELLEGDTYKIRNILNEDPRLICIARNFINDYIYLIKYNIQQLEIQLNCCNEKEKRNQMVVQISKIDQFLTFLNDRDCWLEKLQIEFADHC